MSKTQTKPSCPTKALLETAAEMKSGGLLDEATREKITMRHARSPDDENPEWMPEDFRKARPATEVMGELFGAQAAEIIRRRPGRPPKVDRKVNQTLRLDPDVLDAYRREGQGWQARINAVLREHMPRPEK